MLVYKSRPLNSFWISSHLHCQEGTSMPFVIWHCKLITALCRMNKDDLTSNIKFNRQFYDKK